MQDSLPSQNPKMISSIIISQMIDENKSKENKASLPVSPVIHKPNACCMDQSLANHSTVNVHRAFILLPRELDVEISSDDNGFGTEADAKEAKQCPKQKKGFASITITARRVVPFPHDTMQVDAPYPSCLKCRGGKLLMNTVTASNVTGLGQLCSPLFDQGHCQNKNTTIVKASEPGPQLCKGHCDWISSTENKENKMVTPGSSLNKQAPTSFTSSIHRSVSQQCPNTIYYLDKSLSVPVNQHLTSNQKIHRSFMSFKINCNSLSLTPDGVDGLANGDLITEVLKTKVPEDSKMPLQAIWNADVEESYLDKKQALEMVSLGTKYLSKGSSPTETLSVVDSPQGLDNLKQTKSNDENPRDNHTALSPQIPDQTYIEGE